jgi:hydrogenase nickel incorporation protein HypB
MSTVTVSIDREIRERRRAEAEAFRATLTQLGILCVNLISSPGAGKTSLLEATARHWAARRQMAVLVGDIATDRDAQRLAPFVPVRQLTTGGACHLELPLVRAGLETLELNGIEFLFLENVGNLVCPASHDLGEHLRVALLSVTEGDDKPGKYPKAFHTSRACVVSKIDLLPYVPFSLEAFLADARSIQPTMEILPTSALRNEGIEAWCQFLDSERNRLIHAT